MDHDLMHQANPLTGQAAPKKEKTAMIGGGAYWYVNCQVQHQQAVDAFNDACEALENSIAQLKQVTNPSEAFVIQRITGLPNITGVEDVTESNDPNGKLNKAGGHTATVYSPPTSATSPASTPPRANTGIVAVGNDGGGTVEVYSSVEDAEKRSTYLGAFDGSILSSGSHEVLGTCVLRTSDKLTASQQQTLTQEVKDALIRLE